MASGHLGAILHDLRRLLSAGSVAGMGENQLLERFVAGGDEAAFEALVARHGPMVLTVCRRLLRDEHDVEDAFQATFLVLVRRAGSIQQHDLLANWLYGVAHRVAVRARAQSARRRVVEQQGLNVERPEVAEESLRQDAPVILDEVRRLPAHYRAVVVLCHLEGFSVEDAAAQLRCPAGTVKSRLARARELLRGRLARRGLAGAAVAAAEMATERAAPATVPATVRDLTVRAAVRAASGQAMAGAVPATVISLMEGVLQTMSLNKLKLAGAIVVSLGCLATGAGVMAFQEKGDAPAAKVAGNDPLGAQNESSAAVGKAPDAAQEPKPQAPDSPNRERGRGAIIEFTSELSAARTAALREDARNEVELLRLQVETKQTELAADAARLELQEKETARYGELQKRGAIDQAEFDSSQAGLQQARSRVQVKKAELKEMQLRLAQAERRLAHPEWLEARGDRAASPAASTDWERRIRALEQRVSELSDEVASLKRK